MAIEVVRKGAFTEVVYHHQVLVESGVHFIYKCVIWASVCVFGRAGELEKERVLVFVGMRALVERIWHQKLGRSLQNALFDGT